VKSTTLNSLLFSVALYKCSIMITIQADI